MTSSGSPAEDELMPVRVIALLEEPALNSPVVVLYEPEDNRILPIWIGEPEARAIAMSFQDVEIVRPLTHTLLADVIHAMGGHLDYVAIEDLDASTYYATIAIDIGKRKPLYIDARPSDSIALALEMGAQIYVARSILRMAGQDNPFPEDPQTGRLSIELMKDVMIKPTPESATSESKGGGGGKGGKAGKAGKGGKSKPAAKSHAPREAKIDFDSQEVTQLKALLEKARAKEQDEGPGAGA